VDPLLRVKHAALERERKLLTHQTCADVAEVARQGRGTAEN
jgi:hypothetical protein